MRDRDRKETRQLAEFDPSTPDYPRSAAANVQRVSALETRLIQCRACPRLVAWREHVAAVKRHAYLDWDYWARPVPGFGPPDASVAIIGLAPAAHGGNRTGRIFTGDPSGDLLYASLHAIGVASQPTSTHRGDGLKLDGVRITVPVHCAPPNNQPTTVERDTCRPWLARELQLLRPTLSVIVVLGGFAWQALLPVLADAGWSLPKPRPKFGHGNHILIADEPCRRELHLFGCYHPSQRNVSTRTLTGAMLRDVLQRAVATGTAAPSSA